MAPTPSLVHLPNGQTLTVIPVFGGFFFKANDLNHHANAFSAGWTVILQTEKYSDDHDGNGDSGHVELRGGSQMEKHRSIGPFRQPTLSSDNLFISSISNPSSNDFKAPTSPTRQIAMMLWATLQWYFHLPEPKPQLHTEAARFTPEVAKPRGKWRINIKREGVFRGRNLIQKLERMGLITSDDSAIGTTIEENSPEGWSEMYTSRRSYWQLSPRLFLFTLSPTIGSSFPGSPFNSRPSSPVRGDQRNRSPRRAGSPEGGSPLPSPVPWQTSTPGPFSSGSHLPTYFPPPPLQYTMTSGVRHPNRPKPPRQGEIFYTRYIQSVGGYLTFRAASLAPKPVRYNGPTTHPDAPRHTPVSSLSSLPAHLSSASISGATTPTVAPEPEDTLQMTDVQLLHKWMNVPRVSKFWGSDGPSSVQEDVLRKSLSSKHSFPVIGLWDGKPFGFFEIYWVKEDILGNHLGDNVGDYDRGFHVLVGEEEFRGKHRVDVWSTSIAHWVFLQDYRTNAVVLEPRIDNERFLSHLQSVGYLKEREITFPHKQSAYMKLRRENFEAPAL